MRKKILYGILIACVAAGCSKQEIATYSGRTGVYFEMGTTAGGTQSLTDSSYIKLALANPDLKDSVFLLRMRIIGKPAPEVREISYRLIDSLTTAVPGKHYDALPQTITLPAGAVAVDLPIRFHKTPDMSSQSFTIGFELRENGSFTLPRPQDMSGGVPVTVVRHKVRVDDIVARPANWYDPYMGAYTRKKLLFVCSLTETTVTDFAAMALPRIMFLGRFTQKYLNDQALAGTPVYEDDGSLMKMGASVQ